MTPRGSAEAGASPKPSEPHNDTILDRAIAQVDDLKLRDVLAREVELLRGSRKFGLVFDRHLPESVRLPRHPIRKGVSVSFRDESVDGSWVVTGFKDTSRSSVLLSDGSERPTGELAVVRAFGDPVYPGLRTVERLERGGPADRWHSVVNGENFHVLQVLRSTHRDKVDLIYIDPPYNTGNDSWIYNDRYVDGNDRSRSSKWLSFMERRLLIARELLKPTGVIIVAIGDDEHHRLRMLMDQVFGAQNFISNVVWQGSGKNDAKYTAGGVDYMLIYGRDGESLSEADVRWRESKPGLELALDAASRAWVQADKDAIKATRLYRAELRTLRSSLEPAVFRYDQIDDQGRVFQPTDLTSPNLRANLRYELLHPATGRPVRTPQNGWRYAREVMARLVDSKLVLFGPDEQTSPRFKRLLTDQSDRVPYPSFSTPRMPGSKRLETILGERRFPNPKDVEVLMRWVRLAAPNDGVILDFFGGSGTTTEAVLRLNVEDCGTRQSILVTNNEVGSKQAKLLRKSGHHSGDAEWESKGVFEYVTRPRISTVVTGIRADGSTYSGGLEANVEFLELGYLDPGMVRRGREFEAIAPLLWLEAGASGQRIDTEPEGGWALAESYGVLFDIDALAPFSEAVTERAKNDDPPGVLYVVTDSPSEYQHAIEKLPIGVRTVRLYEDYLTNYTINTDGGVR